MRVAVYLIVFFLVLDPVMCQYSSENEISKIRSKVKKIKKVTNLNEPKLELTGRWRENQAQRKGLNDYLYEIGKKKSKKYTYVFFNSKENWVILTGMPWFRRWYIRMVGFRDEQTIYQDGTTFRINGFRKQLHYSQFFKDVQNYV